MSKPTYNIPVDGKVMACLDASAYADSVVDHATWASQRLQADLVCLHVLDRSPAQPTRADYSGNIGIDTRVDLLEELAELDAQRARLAMRQGRALLEQARQRAIKAGATSADSLQRHGPLVEALTELAGGVRLFVIRQAR